MGCGKTVSRAVINNIRYPKRKISDSTQSHPQRRTHRGATKRRTERRKARSAPTDSAKKIRGSRSFIIKN
jgi:hypothetical protein